MCKRSLREILVSIAFEANRVISLQGGINPKIKSFNFRCNVCTMIISTKKAAIIVLPSPVCETSALPNNAAN